MARRDWKWTQHQLDKLNKVKAILADLQEYKPLTLRQIYYQLVAQGFIENKTAEYNMLSGLIKNARLSGRISWEDIEDRSRIYHDLTGWQSAAGFIKAHIKGFLEGYRRDLLQGQEKYLEIWVEKDALASIFIRAAAPYTVSVVVCRGFNSVSFLNKFKERLEAEDRPAHILYFGDFDPSGLEMLEANKTTLQAEMGIENLSFQRVALSREDIETYKLPHQPEALKRTDTRAKKHLQEYGEIAVELDALRPDILTGKIKESIQAQLDEDTFITTAAQEKEDREMIKDLKNKVIETIRRQT